MDSSCKYPIIIELIDLFSQLRRFSSIYSSNFFHTFEKTSEKSAIFFGSFRTTLIILKAVSELLESVRKLQIVSAVIFAQDFRGNPKTPVLKAGRATDLTLRREHSCRTLSTVLLKSPSISALFFAELYVGPNDKK